MGKEIPFEEINSSDQNGFWHLQEVLKVVGSMVRDEWS